MERDELHPLHFGVGSHLPRPGCGAGGRDLMEAAGWAAADEAAGGGGLDGVWNRCGGNRKIVEHYVSGL
ncbi:MAG: hypothetical protein QF541_22125 [Lentisphaeria bacterium]|nr:hypothetical protein [Lentisphaeria bacterium]